MVRQLTRRLLSGGAMAAAVTVLTAAAAYAAGPNALTITGPGIAEALTLRASERPEQFAAVIREVSWLSAKAALPGPPNAGVPLPGSVSTVTTGGIGGGEAADQPFDPSADLTSLLAEWRQFLLLNGGVVWGVAPGLARTPLAGRRRVDRPHPR